jgi:hypothetical protein
MSFIDERFLTHRLRSTSTAGIVGAALATILWYYRFISDHRWDWDLFAVPVTFIAVKLALMIWYRFTD